MRCCKNEFRLDVSVNSYNMIQLIKRPLHNCSQLLWSLPVIKTCWRNSRTISLIEEMVVTAFLSSCKRLQVLNLPPGVGEIYVVRSFFSFSTGWLVLLWVVRMNPSDHIIFSDDGIISDHSEQEHICTWQRKGFATKFLVAHCIWSNDIK